MKTIMVTAIAAFALSGAAQASIIPVLDSVTADGSDFTYTYSADLSGDQGLQSGNKFVIVDFAGYVAGSVQSLSPDWIADVSNTLSGQLLTEPGYTDDPSVPDLWFIYKGPDFDLTNGPYADTLFTGFTAESTVGTTTTSFFSSAAMKNTGLDQDTKTFNVGLITVPDPAPVPEPATWVIFLAGFFGMGMALRKRKSSGAIAAA